jgi:ATP-dependent DNA ligase
MHPDFERMQYHIFDLIELNIGQAARTLECKSRLYGKNLPSIKFVPHYLVNNLEEIDTKYNEFINLGYEGFILRDLNSTYTRKRSPHMMKYKPKASDEYQILSLEEAISEDGTPKGMLGAFWCIDNMSTKFKVGAGKLTHLERKEIWEKYKQDPFTYINNLLFIEYQCLTNKEKVPRHGRAIRILF